jgi:hypothetical protein
MESLPMSPVLALERCDVRVGRVISFPTSSDEPPRQRIPKQAWEIIRSIASILEDLVFLSLEKRTASEFSSIRTEVFPKYFEAMQALSSLTAIAVPAPVLERLSGEFFSEMEATCRERALDSFGAEVRDQLIFTIWTLRKTSDLCRAIVARPLPPESKDEDAELALKYAQYAVWARFHIDCILKSIETHRPIYPEVLESVIDGLRAAVNAYAWARRGLELRSPAPNPIVSPVEWDEQEQQLLDEATREEVAEV